MTVQGYHHVQLAMPPGGEQVARSFYAELLGIGEVTKPVNFSDRSGCWFENGAIRLHLGVDPLFTPATKAHPAFLVSNLSGLIELLEGAGYLTVGNEPVAGFERRFVHDPFGNRIELMQPVADYPLADNRRDISSGATSAQRQG